MKKETDVHAATRKKGLHEAEHARTVYQVAYDSLLTPYIKARYGMSMTSHPREPRALVNSGGRLRQASGVTRVPAGTPATTSNRRGTVSTRQFNPEHHPHEVHEHAHAAQHALHPAHHEHHEQHTGGRRAVASKRRK